MKPNRSARQLRDMGPPQNERACFGNRRNRPELVSSELQSQPELEVTGIQSTGSLSKCAVGNLVVSAASGCCQDEVGPVKYVESLRLEFQVHALGAFEVFAQGHVSHEQARSNECVAAQIAGAAEAGCSRPNAKNCTHNWLGPPIPPL